MLCVKQSNIETISVWNEYVCVSRLTNDDGSTTERETNRANSRITTKHPKTGNR